MTKRAPVLVLLSASVMACKAQARPVYVPPPPPPAPVAAPPPPPAKLRWGTAPKATGDLFVALEGLCPFMALHPVNHAMLVTYGVDPKPAPSKITTVARFTAEGVEDMSNGLGPIIPVDTIAGGFPEALWLSEWTDKKKGPSGGNLWRWGTGADGREGWEVAIPADKEHFFHVPVRWAGGYLSVDETIDPSSGTTNLALHGINLPANVTPPDLIPSDFNLTDLVGFDSGELYAFGSRPSDSGVIWSARWVSPSDRAVTVHSFGTSTSKAQFIARAPDDVHAIVSGQYYNFENGSWSAVATPTPPWAPPLPDPSAKVVAHDHEGWALSKGAIVKWNGMRWAPVELPPAAFSSSAAVKVNDIAMGPDGEVFVLASYSEKGPFWPDTREYHSVLRSHRPFQTMRCNEPDPESIANSAGRGVQPWPPVADASCKTPFVVLARRSNKHPQAPDYAPLRLPLRGHPELEPIVLMEVKSGDRTYIGTPVKDLTTAQKLLQVETAKIPLHGDIVCADPVPTRSLNVDLATGRIVK
jgi:hypothetical protein